MLKDTTRYLGIAFLDMETKPSKAYKSSQNKMLYVELDHGRGIGSGGYTQTQ